jgi:hypothetical protein
VALLPLHMALSTRVKKVAPPPAAGYWAMNVRQWSVHIEGSLILSMGGISICLTSILVTLGTYVIADYGSTVGDGFGDFET